MSFADKVLNFYSNLNFDKKILPLNVEVMNPYFEDGSYEIKDSIKKFYKKFYNDSNKRKMILGINPGRHGAGVTGIAFTDTKRFNNECGITFDQFNTHEPSSVFIYDVIKAYGGVAKFYKNFYVSAVSPLGFVKLNKRNKLVNYNYYDDSKFKEDIKPFVTKVLEEQIQFGIDINYCFCLGTGQNFKYLKKLNEELGFFREIIPLAHPRYIMQYKLPSKEQFISEYLTALNKI